MALACRPADEGLLLLIHGQLSILSRVKTLAHLAVCPECRRRRDELAKATSALAGAVRGPSMPAWRPHATLLSARLSTAIAVAVIALSLLIAYRSMQGGSTSAIAPGSSPSGGQQAVANGGKTEKCEPTMAVKP